VTAPPSPSPSPAERRRVAQITFRNRVRATAIGRATNFLPWPAQLLLFAGLAIAIAYAVAMITTRLLQGDYYYRQRITQMEAAMVAEDPAKDSRYCRNVYADSPLYADCWAGERVAHAQFIRAWARGRGLSTLRDQMIRCYQEGQEVSGRSWQTAARCAELDRDLGN
jgi:hypothetical protein